MVLKIGTDPELFVRERTRGTFRSGHGLIPGSKVNPHRVDKGAVQVDGMALEFNIDPVETEEDFCIHINTVLSKLREMVPQEYDLDISPVAHFTAEHMDAQPDEAKMLGCDTDFCAWTGAANNPPDQHPTMRTASGHIHLGWTEGVDPMDPKHFERCCILAKQLDYYLGLPSVVIDRNKERRKMYGKAGCFRPKPFGIEYRTLSNFWLKDKELITWVFKAARQAFDDLTQFKRNMPREAGSIVRDVIDLNRVEWAAEDVQTYQLPVPSNWYYYLKAAGVKRYYR